MDCHNFLIGPGGVGKTSCGPHRANLLGREFVDLDQLFMEGPGHIGRYIAEHGYGQYVRENSQIFFEQIVRPNPPCVCALSSGFLIREVEFETVEMNRVAVRDFGYSVLPLPHANVQKCSKIVVSRQLQRGLNLTQETELPKFLERLPIYRSLADQVTIFQGRPEAVAYAIYVELPKGRFAKSNIS